jgi:hypothetical protein
MEQQLQKQILKTLENNRPMPQNELRICPANILRRREDERRAMKAGEGMGVRRRSKEGSLSYLQRKVKYNLEMNKHYKEVQSR